MPPPPTSRGIRGGSGRWGGPGDRDGPHGPGGPPNERYSDRFDEGHGGKSGRGMYDDGPQGPSHGRNNGGRRGGGSSSHRRFGPMGGRGGHGGSSRGSGGRGMMYEDGPSRGGGGRGSGRGMHDDGPGQSHHGRGGGRGMLYDDGPGPGPRGRGGGRGSFEDGPGRGRGGRGGRNGRNLMYDDGPGNNDRGGGRSMMYDDGPGPGPDRGDRNIYDDGPAPDRPSRKMMYDDGPGSDRGDRGLMYDDGPGPDRSDRGLMYDDGPGPDRSPGPTRIRAGRGTYNDGPGSGRGRGGRGMYDDGRGRGGRSTMYDDGPGPSRGGRKSFDDGPGPGRGGRAGNRGFYNDNPGPGRGSRGMMFDDYSGSGRGGRSTYDDGPSTGRSNRGGRGMMYDDIPGSGRGGRENYDDGPGPDRGLLHDDGPGSGRGGRSYMYDGPGPGSIRGGRGNMYDGPGRGGRGNMYDGPGPGRGGRGMVYDDGPGSSRGSRGMSFDDGPGNGRARPFSRPKHSNSPIRSELSQEENSIMNDSNDSGRVTRIKRGSSSMNEERAIENLRNVSSFKNISETENKRLRSEDSINMKAHGRIDSPSRHIPSPTCYGTSDKRKFDNDQSFDSYHGPISSAGDDFYGRRAPNSDSFQAVPNSQQDDVRGGRKSHLDNNFVGGPPHKEYTSRPEEFRMNGGMSSHPDEYRGDSYHHQRFKNHPSSNYNEFKPLSSSIKTDHFSPRDVNYDKDEIKGQIVQHDQFGRQIPHSNHFGENRKSITKKFEQNKTQSDQKEDKTLGPNILNVKENTEVNHTSKQPPLSPSECKEDSSITKPIEDKTEMIKEENIKREDLSGLSTKVKQEEKESNEPSHQRSETPIKSIEKLINIPPSPPPAEPSGLALAIARLSDLSAQMEFQYAKHLLLSNEHEIIKAKISVLKDLPVGMDALRDDLDRMQKESGCKTE
mmetsp:Transcript_3151/g.4429  ORF Transcript_3151/g.4429 Transcript_3151/m.4429 type:complete len:940 (-) Transcript_3151:1126-3945(-)